MQRSVGRPSQYCGRGQEETVGEALAQTQLRRGKALAEKKSAQSNGIGADPCAVIFTIGWYGKALKLQR